VVSCSDMNWVFADYSDTLNVAFHDKNAEFAGSISEGISKVDDHVVTGMMWIYCGVLTLRKHPVQYVVKLTLAASCETLIAPVPVASCDSDTNVDLIIDFCCSMLNTE